MTESTEHLYRYVNDIRNSGLTIYDPIRSSDLRLLIPTTDLELLLDAGLVGASVAGLSIRTRSKVVKEMICQVLGYPAPRSFKRVQPRFPGQDFDVYVQKSNNLQIWNEAVSANRRYVIVRVSPKDHIVSVRVVTGDVLGQLDTTGTLTQKYQARVIVGDCETELISTEDTERLKPFVSSRLCLDHVSSPTAPPNVGSVLSVSEIHDRLTSLVRTTFEDAGHDQERNRGAALHRLVCRALGYSDYGDDGRYPDIRNQLLEVKLQTSPTIDLGLVSPDSTDPLDVPRLNGQQIRHCDVRYAIFYATIARGRVQLANLFVVRGDQFFTRFPKFGGNVVNRKLQIPLPTSFFD